MHGGYKTLVDDLIKMKNYTLVCVQLSAYVRFIIVMDINTEKSSCMHRKSDGT